MARWTGTLAGGRRVRTCLSIIILITGITCVLAAPRPGKPEGPGKPGEQLNLTEIHAFAEQLLTVIDQVADGYHKPIAREELLHAALVGLYQAARKPVPPDLQARIDKASKAGGPILRTASSA